MTSLINTLDTLRFDEIYSQHLHPVCMLSEYISGINLNYGSL